MMMFFWPFFLVVGLVMLVVWAVRGGQGQLPMMGCMMGHGDMSQQTQDKTAVDILKVRYARGEITKEQFEDIHRTIGD